MNNPNTKNPPVLTMPLTVPLDEQMFARLPERSRRDNVTISFLVRRLILENENGKRAAQKTTCHHRDVPSHDGECGCLLRA
jgi:hypothetical protein